MEIETRKEVKTEDEPDTNNESVEKQEIKLIFLGSFVHDSFNECNIDLIQFKESCLISEIRVIPLGATVNLADGNFQMGATNPSVLDLEFYYNDLQVPEKAIFNLLGKFNYNDKSKIQLILLNEPETKIYTNGLLVRGLYSALTLAIYGYVVDNVPIKVAEIKIEESVLKKEIHSADGGDNLKVKLDESDSLTEENLEKIEKEIIEDSPKCKNIKDEKESHLILVSETPQQVQSIPIITTRINFNPSPSKINIEKEDERRRGCDSFSSDHSEKSPQRDNNNLENDVKDFTNKPIELIGTELISDGEISSEDFPMDLDEDDDEEKAALNQKGTEENPKATINEPDQHQPSESENKDILTSSSPVTVSVVKDKIEIEGEKQMEESPPPEQFSDHDSFNNYEHYEEILSDDEIPEYIDEENDNLDAEWEENWAAKFITIFDPFSESFSIKSTSPLKLTDPESTQSEIESAKEKFKTAFETYSELKFEEINLESWIKCLEDLIPFLSIIYPNLKNENEISEFIKIVQFWLEKSLDFNLAIKQTSLPFNVRHLKTGIRFGQTLLNIDPKLSQKLTSSPQNGKKNLIHQLIDVLDEGNMNLSTRLLIIRSLDAVLNYKSGFLKFINLKENKEDSNYTPYQRLIYFSLNNPRQSVRLTFGIRSLLNKINTWEELDTLRIVTENIIKSSLQPYSSDSSPTNDSNEYNLAEEALVIFESLVKSAENVDQKFSHPSRILPAKTVIELPSMNSPGHNPKASFVKILEGSNFLAICAVLLNRKEFYSKIVHSIYNLFQTLLGWEEGIIYFFKGGQVTTTVIKTLLHYDDDSNGFPIYFAHCLEIMNCLESIASDKDKDLNSSGEDSPLRSLQIMNSFMANSIGREALLNTITLGNYVKYLTKLIKNNENTEISKSGKFSAKMGYASELIIFLVKNSGRIEYLEKEGGELYSVITNTERGDREILEKMQQIIPFITPALNPDHHSYDGIELLSDIIKTKLDTIRDVSIKTNGFPPEIITVLRILEKFGVPQLEDDITQNLKTDADETRVKELKYEIALVKMYLSDCLTSFISILNKIIEDFILPGIQPHILLGSKGETLIAILLPLIKLVRRILTKVIQIRQTEFKDLTHISVLLQIYTLMDLFPASSHSYGKAQEISQNIIATFLSYTIPAVRQGEESEEVLNKSTWTAVIAELLKFTLSAPYAFNSGLNIFSELLPLPLPIASKIPLTEAECIESLKLRRLWSAYLHGISPQIQEVIGVLCGSTNPRLINTLKRVCLQLADLSSSTCLVVCRSILEQILSSLDEDFEAENYKNIAKKEFPCSSNSARILGFLASLISNSGVIKCGLLEIIRGMTKLDEKYADFIQTLSSILNYNYFDKSSHVQAQDNIISIFQSISDIENNILLPMFGRVEKQLDKDVIIANSLPQKDTLNIICSATLTYLNNMGDKISNGHTVEDVLRTLSIVAETDYGFFHLKKSLEKLPTILSSLLVNISSDLENPEVLESLWPCISSFLDLLKTLTSPKGENYTSILPQRTASLKISEVSNLLAWNTKGEIEPKDESSSDISPKRIKLSEADNIEDDKEKEKEQIHPFTKLKDSLEKYIKTDGNSRGIYLPILNYQSIDIDNAVLLVKNIHDSLSDTEKSKSGVESESSEISIPFPDSLNEIFSIRPVNVLLDKVNTDTLPSFWMTSIPPAFYLDGDQTESDLENENLIDLIKSYCTEADILKEIESIYNISDFSGPDSQEKTIKNQIIKPRPLNETFKPGSGRGLLSLPPAHKQIYGNSMRGSSRGSFGRGGLLPGPNMERKGQSSYGRPLFDPFRSRPPNTSRPPSLHVDDFVALENTSSGNTGYNKQPNRNMGGMGGGGSLSDFSARQRGSGQRSSMGGRPYNNNNAQQDRNRPMFRNVPCGNSYYQQPRNEGLLNLPRGKNMRGGGGGRVNQYGRLDQSQQMPGRGMGNYNDDKQLRYNSQNKQMNMGGGGNRHQFSSRNSYKDPPLRSLTDTSGPSGSSGLMNQQRWNKPRSGLR